MPFLDMGALSDPFNAAQVDAVVTKTSPGNFALGRMNGVGFFVTEFVGRADVDLRSELKKHLNSGYTRFKYSYALSAEEAFAKECKIFHDFSPKDNLTHPRGLEGQSWKCSYCKVFESETGGIFREETKLSKGDEVSSHPDP